MEKPVIPQQINIRPEDTTLVLCKECECPHFMQATSIRKLSSIISPSGREEFFNVPVLLCLQCGEVLEMGA